MNIADRAGFYASMRRVLRPLGLHIIMGPQFAEMAANLGRNLQEGRVRLVQAIMARA